MRRPHSPILLSLLAALGGCILIDDNGSQSSTPPAPAPQLSARIDGRSGCGLNGTATFTERNGGVLVQVELRGAPPGFHGVHIHERGDCSAPDAKSAGGHFNPTQTQHGSPFRPDHHLGDLGNLWVGPDGTGFHAVFMPGLTVLPGGSTVKGKAIVVHEKPDDFQSQPSGDAGSRIGCGVIH